MFPGLARPQNLRFLVLGDWGGLPNFPYRTPIEEAVAVRLADIAHQRNASFTLALGDNFYFDGVQSIEDPRFQVLKYAVHQLRMLLQQGGPSKLGITGLDIKDCPTALDN